MTHYQENINDSWEFVPENFSLTYKTFPFVFHHDYDKYKLYENGNKIIAPKELLFRLSKYDNINYPIHVKISDEFLKSRDLKESSIFTIMDFSEDIDNIYIPNSFYRLIELDKLIDTDNYVKFEIINNPLEKATKIKLKPFKSSFYQIPNPKEYLEIHLKRNYSVLKKEQIISLIFKDTYLDFDIVELGNESTDTDNNAQFYSIIDTELSVEFEKSYDYVEPVSYPKVQSNGSKGSNGSNSKEDSCNRFPGKGNRLGS